MINRTTVTISSLFILLTVFSGGNAAQESLRNTLENTWRAYLKASKSGKESELEKTMSSFRLGTLRNNLASARSVLTPDIIESIAEDVSDISTAKFVTMMEKGPTAGLVYVEDSEEKDETGKPRVNFIFIKFVKEESVWKVDARMDIGSPKFNENGKQSEFNPSDLPPTYEIDGQVRSAPKPIAIPDFSAFLDVSSTGYKIQVTVNGIEQETGKSESHSGLLKGGLRKGKNNIVIVVTQTEKDTPFKPRVTIRRIHEDRKTTEVFTFEPKENIEGKHSLDFTFDK
ncbi:MAG: hypothetical protein V1799_08780 [bacterium]